MKKFLPGIALTPESPICISSTPSDYIPGDIPIGCGWMLFCMYTPKLPVKIWHTKSGYFEYL